MMQSPRSSRASKRRILDALSLTATIFTFLFACFRLLGGNDARGGSQRCTPAPQLSQLGVFQGESPFDLRPLELLHPAVEGAGAWPAANPVRVTSGPGDGDAPVKPFLFPTHDRLYAFYEEAWCTADGGRVGRIAAAESIDAGITWEPMGVVLSEDWPLSKPFVFEHDEQVYMVPDSPTIGEVNLFHATRFPVSWKYMQTLVEAPLHSVSLAAHNGSWWLFGNRPEPGDEESAGMGGTLEVYKAPAPQGPWRPHASAPASADMFTRVLEHGGGLMRLGRPCSGGRCGSPAAFEVTLSNRAYHQRQLGPTPLLAHSRQPAAWDGAGHSHVDIVQLPNGKWLAAATGSRVTPQLPLAAVAIVLLGPLSEALAVCAFLALIYTAMLRSAVAQRLLAWTAWGQHMLARSWRCAAPSLALAASGPVPDAPTVYISLTPTGKARPRKTRWAWLPGRHAGRRLVPWRAVALSVGAAVLVGGAAAVQCMHHALGPFWRPIQQLPGSDGRNSRFTLMVMSFEKRLESLKYYIQHYSQCPSVGEILVVWNKGVPPAPEDLHSLLPVRVRVESENSMNNRYKPDPEIRFRAVLSLDDDIMMPCSDIERGFAAWRQQPDKIVGYYPRLITQGKGGSLAYNWEDSTVKQGEYNALLTGAAFLDARISFAQYWAPAVAPARRLVDELVNCDDLLMNFVVANASSSGGSWAAGSRDGGGGGMEENGPVLEFVRPERRFDISYLSGVGLSHDPSRFQQQAEQCLAEFVRVFGANPLRARQFDWDSYSAPYCGWPTTRALGCFYL